MIPLATRLARAGFADPETAAPAAAADPWPTERRAILDELRRRIERLEKRTAEPTVGPRLPPGAPPPGSAHRLRRLGDLNGAEEVAWGARFSARSEGVVPSAAGIVASVPRWLGRLAGVTEPIADGLDHVRVLDCETTGLAGGTGTLAFLVGIGRFEPHGTFRVDQILLRGPASEPGFLDDLHALLEGGTALVTFNGRAFDGPLLRTRCVLARRRPGALASLPHVDLLPVARRMWRDRGDDCRLVTLEERVLRRRRVDDVGGFMAPAAYADFLRGGDPSALGAIVSHNRDDIVGTAALLVAALKILADPLRFAEDATELRAAAHLHGAHDGIEPALPILARALELARASELRRRILSDLAGAQRRLGLWDGATATWAQYAREFPGENRGFVEIAKVLERRRKDVAGALGMVRRAPHPAAVDLEHRRARLELRLSRKKARAIDPILFG